MKDTPLQNLISELKKLSHSSKASLWKAVALELEKGTRRRRVVNISKLSKVTRDGETVLVPGKVLGTGDLDNKLSVAAYSFSEQAKAKILEKKGLVMSISELAQKNPEGKKVRIVG